MSKVAVVTGGNKGIGFAIVRGLCKQFKGDVYLTARDVSRGEKAVEDLKSEGLQPKFHQLDLEDSGSIRKLKEFLETKYGGLDLLVNNAGIAYKQSSTAPFHEQAKVTLKTNYFATLDVCNTLFPILKPGARVVHVSSGSSNSAMKKASDARRKQFCEAATIADVSALMEEFVKDAKEGKHKERGWSDSAYGNSKVGVTVMTPIQQAAFDQDKSRPDIVVNACCPGYVSTDMSSFTGPLTIDEGAETPLYLALLPPNVQSPRGEFCVKKQAYNWKVGEYHE